MQLCLMPWRSHVIPFSPFHVPVCVAPGALPLSIAAVPLFSLPSSAAIAPPVLTSAQPQSGTSLTWHTPTLPALASKPTDPPTSPPFCLASSLPPVPAKLVKRIQALEFVEMRELLPDNMALAERLEALPIRTGQPAKQAEQREVGSLITWVSSFTTYVAVVAEAHPERVRDMLAYMRLIVREAHKHGGQGWLTYDAVFRRNNQGAAQPWNILDPSLHTAYVASPASLASTVMRQIILQRTAHSPPSCNLSAPPPSEITCLLRHAPPSGHLPLAPPSLQPRGYASLGTRGSVPSQEPAITIIAVPCATAQTTRQEIAPRPQQTASTSSPLGATTPPR